ncbi:hypothetical protein C8Q80DRAFT_1274253 [Daedaleopsis nitida]|nr:hypothetical protein C8Q80DRAFT_1274253 [Daedaleopsis nitida]
MHHHMHHMYAMRGCGRGTHRLLWFVFGVGAATWWHRHKDVHGWAEARRAWSERIPQNPYDPTIPAALPPSYQQPESGAENLAGAAAPPSPPGHKVKWERWGWDEWGKGPWRGHEDANPKARWERWGWHRNTTGTQGPWSRPSEEKDALQQAPDGTTEVSEVTLNNLLATVESLKARLAEQQREQQERELQTSREAKFKQFEEWQRQQEQALKEEKKPDPPRKLV